MRCDKRQDYVLTTASRMRDVPRSKGTQDAEPGGRLKLTMHRQVKCDERPNICGNCEKLNLTCVQPGTGATVGASLHHDRALKACRECRSAKIRCSGAVGQPCQRCQDRSLRCEHDAKPEPRWISQSRAVPASPTKEEQRSPARAEEKGKSAVSDKTRHGHELVWCVKKKRTLLCT